MSLASLLRRLLVIFLCTWSVLGQCQQPDPELLQRMQELSQRAQSCGPDPACLQAVQDELLQLNEQLMGSQPAQETPPPQDIQRHGAIETAAREALRGRADDPCYVVYYQKELAQRMRGSDLPWLGCIPALITVRWHLNEGESLQKYQAEYTVEERYPAYLEIEHDQDHRDTLVGYRLVGPAPQGRAKASARVVEGNATLTGVRYHGIFSPTPTEQKSFGTGNVADFRADPDTAGIEFQYYAPPPADTVITHTLRLAGSDTAVNIHRENADLGADFHDPQIRVDGASAFSVAEIREGLRTGTLTKTFPVNVSLYSLNQTGEAEVTIAFDREPGRLAVSPSTRFVSSGPDRQDRFVPASTEYTLRNSGGVVLQWSASSKADWLGLSSSSGVLAPGQQQRLIAAVNSKARNLDEGTHKTQIAFVNQTDGRGSTVRDVVLHVGETQVWQVRLTGRYEFSRRNVRDIYEPGASTPKRINDIKTVSFDYQLAGEFTLKKQKGKWVYSGGTVTASALKHDYQQIPKNLWQVLGIRCERCDDVVKLKGQSLPGLVSGNDVFLYWPVVRPALEVDAVMALKCQPNPTDPSACPSAAKGGTAYYEDDVFLQKTHGHRLPLRNGKVAIKPERNKTAGYSQTVVHTYWLKRLR
jgi:hypothetical protein